MSRADAAPLEILPAVMTSGDNLVEFGRDLDHECHHVPACPLGDIEVANRAQLVEALRAVEANPHEGASAKIGQTRLYEDDLRMLIRTLDERA